MPDSGLAIRYFEKNA